MHTLKPYLRFIYNVKNFPCLYVSLHAVFIFEKSIFIFLFLHIKHEKIFGKKKEKHVPDHIIGSLFLKVKTSIPFKGMAGILSTTSIKKSLQFI